MDMKFNSTNIFITENERVSENLNNDVILAICAMSFPQILTILSEF